MTKPKPSSEQKAYRGKQGYLTEEQIAVLEKPQCCTGYTKASPISRKRNKLSKKTTL